MMSSRDFNSFSDRSAWRSWLEDNSSTSVEIWVLVQKKHSPSRGIFLDEAVEEALCFGWIDSTLNPKDENSYLLRFSPRKKGSVWSIRNIQRVEMLTKDGQMRKAGLAAVQEAKKSGTWQEAIDRENPDYLPPDLEEALNQDPIAQQAYSKLSESERKRNIYWLQSAKQDKTRKKRISDILDRLLNEN